MRKVDNQSVLKIVWNMDCLGRIPALWHDGSRSHSCHFFSSSSLYRQKHSLVGDVRGLGMMLGIELVEDRETKAPAPAAAAYVLERARQLGVHIQVEAIGRTPFYVRTS